MRQLGGDCLWEQPTVLEDSLEESAIIVELAPSQKACSLLNRNCSAQFKEVLLASS